MICHQYISEKNMHSFEFSYLQLKILIDLLYGFDLQLIPFTTKFHKKNSVISWKILLYKNKYVHFPRISVERLSETFSTKLHASNLHK